MPASHSGLVSTVLGSPLKACCQDSALTLTRERPSSFLEYPLARFLSTKSL